eukprot:scaffold11927_cov174-Skeletonema_menzelii.AAC.3
MYLRRIGCSTGPMQDANGDPRTRTVTPAALQSKTFCSCLDLVYHIYSIISAAGRWMEEQMLRQVGTHEAGPKSRCQEAEEEAQDGLTPPQQSN